jgi:putative membrane protein
MAPDRNAVAYRRRLEKNACSASDEKEGMNYCSITVYSSLMLLPVLLILTLIALIVSGIQPYDRLTWWMEVMPVLIALPVLIFTRRRFPLTTLLYSLLFFHGLVLMLGGHYTYARVPLGLWMQDWLDFSRNHYDRIGHLVQGFVPAILAREILIRLSPLGAATNRGGGWVFFLVCCVVLATSASYEFIEWWAALLYGSDADSFLATQGDPWDTQWDMLLALLGCVTSQILLSQLHNWQLMRLK